MTGAIGNAQLGLGAIGNVTMSKGYIGSVLIYSAGNTVTYHVDTDVVYQEEVDADETVLSPKTFTPSKSGWDFVGWRQDTIATNTVLDSLAMGDDSIELYAVFSRTITLSYAANGGSGTTAEQSGLQYYNAFGTFKNPSFVLRPCGFSRANYVFSNWRLNSSSGINYAVNSSITISENTVMYAYWTAAVVSGSSSVSITRNKEQGGGSATANLVLDSSLVGKRIQATITRSYSDYFFNGANKTTTITCNGTSIYSKTSTWYDMSGSTKTESDTITFTPTTATLVLTASIGADGGGTDTQWCTVSMSVSNILAM